MGTHTQLIYHIAFSTKHRELTIVQDQKKRMFAFIHQLLTNKNCHLYRINGVEDHIHILSHVHPTIAISSLVKDIKLASDDFIKREGIFPKFKGWQDGYGAFSESIKAKERLINYLINQEEHHKKVSFLDEYKALLKEFEIDFDEKYLLYVQASRNHFVYQDLRFRVATTIPYFPFLPTVSPRAIQGLILSGSFLGLHLPK